MQADGVEILMRVLLVILMVLIIVMGIVGGISFGTSGETFTALLSLGLGTGGGLSLLVASLKSGILTD